MQGEAEFHSEKKKIKRQFAVFTFAYIIRAAASTYLGAFTPDTYLEIRLIDWIFRAPIDILPITYVLYVHHRIYKRMATAMDIKEAILRDYMVTDPDNGTEVRYSEFSIGSSAYEDTDHGRSSYFSKKRSPTGTGTSTR